MNDLRNRLAALSPEQRARLLERVRKERPADSAGEGVTASYIPAADRTQPLPLSFAQRRIWFLERLEGRSAAYNMPAAFRLLGKLDTAAVAAALQEIARRHEVLRTRLIDHDGEPVQQIDAEPGASLCRTLSLVDTPAADRDDALRAVLREEAGDVFDLALEHPIRALLIQLDTNEHVLAVTLHHAASDGWSTGVLVREFAALYTHLRQGYGGQDQMKPVPGLADLPVQYADFAQWQRQQVAADEVTRPHLDYWRTQLADAPGVINLPVDASLPRHSGSREAANATAGEAVYFRIDAETAEAVNALARQTDSSAYMVLLAAFMALLHRWSGEVDLTVGSPIANRPRKELEGLIGFFVNTLALRVNAGGDPDFLALIARVRATALEGYAHAELPFELVVEKLNPERRLNRQPFFQVMFAMQSGALQDVALDGLQIEAVPLATGAARLDITLSIQETSDGFAGCLEYSTALFRTETAQRFAEHFRNMVEAAVRQPATPLSQLDYLGYGERHRLLVEWNRTDMPFRPRCLHQLVEDQAARTPDAIALRWNGTAWSYAQLMARVDGAALQLQQKGVGTETLVGVCMSRTPDMVVALLGVLKAGGAYVALDPAYPAARTEYVIADSGATIVLRDGDLDAMSQEPLPGEFQPPAISPSNLAYVLYTSGSTGQPKGVAIEHRSPAALIAWAQTVWSPAELSGVLAGTSICFDLSVFEIFLPLSVGGTVVLANNVLELPNLADRSHVTLINTVPSAIDALLIQRALPSSVRIVNLAGEPLTTELADRIYDVPTVEKVYDLYGPSEDTTYSTFILRRRGDPPSIGRPIANTRLYILDKSLQPVPVGVPGEIFLAGQGLARGYLGRPDLTSERFIPNPFTHRLVHRSPGGGGSLGEGGTGVDRLYRTGDRARFRDDGNVEFLGRFDHQVKLRGFRIELGEIESVARAFPDVGQCVVTVEQSNAGTQRLVAYASHPRGQAIADALHAHLRSRLPEYMVPPALVVLEQLPLTPNGKIDRKALPSPGQRQAAADAGPLSADEARLATLWQSLMAVERVRPHDDFFGLGGHSLLAAKLGARIRDSYQVDLPLRTIFEHSTLRAQAAAIAALQADSTDDAIPVIARGPRMPLSFAQERLWFLDQLEPGNPAYNMAGAIRLRGAVDLDGLRAAFDRIVGRQELLRTVFPTIEGRGYAAPALQPPVLREIATTDVDAFLAEEQARPFALATGPLIRASAIRVSPDETVLAVTMHHIISDGWSIEVFLDELCRFYAAQVDGNAAALAPLAVQYIDFAAWQRARFASGLLAPQLAYWRQTLAGAPAVLELPTDRPRPESQSYEGAAYAVTLESSLAALVSQRAREAGVTSFMTLLAAFGVVLNRWSGQDDMVIGFPAAGRGRSELEPLIGMFVNTVPIRLQMPAGSSFASLLAHVKTRTVDALTHQDVPFEKLVDELGVERSLAWSPLFQVMFISQQAAAAPALPAGLRAEPIPNSESGTAKFDLTLAVAERDGGLSVSVEYDRALFDAATIERFAADYAGALRHGLESPNAPLVDVASAFRRTSSLSPAPITAVAISRPDEAAADGSRGGQPATPIETALTEIWRQVLRLDDVRVTDNFFEVGGDSIVSIQVIAQLRDRGWRVDPRQIFRHQTIRALAAVAEPVAAATVAIEEPAGPIPLSPMQRLFFDLKPSSPNHFNQSLLLVVTADVAVADLQAALTEVQRAHPALRSRFRAGANGWEEHVHPAPDVVIDRREVAPHNGVAYEVEAICQAAQRSLDIVNGPVFKAVLVECGSSGSRLFLVAHHLVVDAVSWRIILADLEAAYSQARGGRPPALPAEHCGPAAFRKLAGEWSHSPAAADQAGYWEAVASAAGSLFTARTQATPIAVTVTRTLGEDETRPLLGPAHRAYNTTTADLLLAAFARALGVVAGRDAFLVDVEGHGRDALPDADLSRSVGWFTTLYPVRVTGAGTSDAAALIRAVKESSRSVPNGGIGFGLRHAGSAPVTDVSFNFLGQAGTVLGDGLVRSLAPEASGDTVAADLPRRYHLELNASVVDGRLVTHYSFDAAAVPEARAAEVADRTLAALRELAEHCLSVDGARYTPSDFAAVPIDQQELDALLGDLDLSGLSDA